MGDPFLEGTRLTVGVLLLAYASISDLRYRTVQDRLWIMLGTTGFVLLVYDLLIPHFQVPVLLGLMGSYLAFMDMVIPRPPVWDEGKPNFKALLLPATSWILFSMGILMDYRANTIPIIIAATIVIVYFMYRFNLIVGGADAKALMAICLLMPIMQPLDSIPIVQNEYSLTYFPFVISVFVYSGLVQILLLPYYGIKNALKGDFSFPRMFTGEKKELPEVEREFLWALEEMKDGEIKHHWRPYADVFDPAPFKDRGINMVWTTPQHPGILYLLVGFICAFLIGNPFDLLFGVVF